MGVEFTGEGHQEQKKDDIVPIGELRISAMILAAVGVVVATISYVQCCFPVAIVGLALSFFAYQKSVESGNGLAKNLSVVGMVMAVIEMLIIIFVIILYVLYFAFIISMISNGVSRSY